MPVTSLYVSLQPRRNANSNMTRQNLLNPISSKHLDCQIFSTLSSKNSSTILTFSVFCFTYHLLSCYCCSNLRQNYYLSNQVFIPAFNPCFYRNGIPLNFYRTNKPPLIYLCYFI